jgi:hypothetical protein
VDKKACGFIYLKEIIDSRVLLLIQGDEFQSIPPTAWISLLFLNFISQRIQKAILIAKTIYSEK